MNYAIFEKSFALTISAAVTVSFAAIAEPRADNAFPPAHLATGVHFTSTPQPRAPVRIAPWYAAWQSDAPRIELRAIDPQTFIGARTEESINPWYRAAN